MELAQAKEGQMLFVKRDMFNDSGFPMTYMPPTKEALLSFIADMKLKNEVFEPLKHFDLKIEKYHGDLIVVIYYKDESHGHWVIGFVREQMPEGMELPFQQSFGPDDLVLAEGYVSKVVKEADPEIRGDHPIHYWAKEEV